MFVEFSFIHFALLKCPKYTQSLSLLVSVNGKT